jgi:hypothetical protein
MTDEYHLTSAEYSARAEWFGQSLATRFYRIIPAWVTWLLVALALCLVLATATQAQAQTIAFEGSSLILQSEPASASTGNEWPVPDIRNQHHIVLDLTGRHVTKTLNIINSTDVRVIGGDFDGGGLLTTGINVDERGLPGVDHGITLSGQTIHGFTRSGVKATGVQGLMISNEDLSAMGSDGIDVSMSNRVYLSANRCHDFTPQALAHADCIQFDKGTPANDNVFVAGNTITGQMQGIFGQANNATVIGNTISTPFANAISLTGTGTLNLLMNKVATLPGGVPPTQARITLFGYATVNRQGNTTAAAGRFPALAD